MKKRRKQKRSNESIEESFSDEQFAFIAGYTSGGAPYGVTWEEVELEQDNVDIDHDDFYF